MISYCWAQQDVVLRIKKALAEQGYVCWLDVEQMSLSTVDAMAEAIDSSYAVVYGISLDYKESANCRLEVSGSVSDRQGEIKPLPRICSRTLMCAKPRPPIPSLPVERWGVGDASHWYLLRAVASCSLFLLTRALLMTSSHPKAMYAHQAKVQMIPMLLQENYAPKGWLGMLLGTQLWYGFFGSMLKSDAAFRKRINELCRALGRPERANQPAGSHSSSSSGSSGGASAPQGSAAMTRSAPPSTPTAPPVTNHALAYAPQLPSSTPLAESAAALGGGGARYLDFSSAPSPLRAASSTLQTPDSHAHSEIGQLLSHARENMVRLEERQTQSIARLEERQHQSFIEELSAAKTVARLEAELKAKDREVARLEAELIKQTMYAAALAAGVLAIVAVVFAKK